MRCDWVLTTCLMLFLACRATLAIPIGFKSVLFAARTPRIRQISQQASQGAPYSYLHLECNGTSVLVVAPSFGQIDSRIFLWDATFTSSPAWLEYVRGQEDFQHGDLQAAEKHLREAIKWTDSCYDQVAHHDSFALAHELLGQVYLSERLNRKAKAEFQTTLRMDPHSGGAWIGLGTVLNDLGRYDEAIKALTQGVQETPDNLWGRTNSREPITRRIRSSHSIALIETLFGLHQSFTQWPKRGHLIRQLSNCLQARLKLT